MASARSSLISGQDKSISTADWDVLAKRVRAGLLPLQPPAQVVVVAPGSLACHQAVRHLCCIITNRSSRSHRGRRRCVPRVVSSQQTQGIVFVAAHAQLAEQRGQLLVGDQLDHLCCIITNRSSRSHRGRRRCVPRVVSSQQTQGIVFVAAHAQLAEQRGQLLVGDQLDQYQGVGFFPPASCIPHLTRECARSATRGPLRKGIRFVVGAVPMQLHRLDGSTASPQVRLLILRSWNRTSPRYGRPTFRSYPPSPSS